MDPGDVKSLIRFGGIIIVTSIFSMFVWYTIFDQLDYYGVEYNNKTKKKVLCLIFSSIFSITMFVYCLFLFFSL